MANRIDSGAPSRRPGLTLHNLSHPQDSATYTNLAPTTPKTPADEGKEFFLSPRSEREQPIRVYELRLDPDGGPNKQRSVSWIDTSGVKR
jgi:glycogen debranching enzyme